MMSVMFARVRGRAVPLPPAVVFFSSLRGYRRSWLPADLLAALTLLVIAIPEQLATSRLAAMPPITGFYAFAAGTALFAFLGSNPQMSVGADSTIAPLFAVGIAHLAPAGSAQYVDLVGILAVAVGVLVALVWLRAGWPGVTVLAAVVLAALVVLRVSWPHWFARLVSGPARNRWRWWFYRRHWQAVMTITRLAPTYRGRVVVPVLGKVTVTGCTDRVSVRLVSGQSPADFAARAEGIAHGFRAHLCRVRTGRPGAIVLELVRRDALADPMPALPIPDVTDLRALAVGRREDGTPFAVRLQGTHLLIAGVKPGTRGRGAW